MLPGVQQQGLRVPRAEEIVAEAEQPAAVETKYACRVCGHTWKERVAVMEAG
jgi:rubrerythrin